MANEGDTNREIFGLRPILHAIGLTVALVTAIVIPFGYTAISYLDTASDLMLKSRIGAQRIAQYVYAHGELWLYTSPRSSELIAFYGGPANETYQKISDREGVFLADAGRPVIGWTIARHAPIVVDGATVGFVETVASAKPLVLGTAISVFFGLGLGIAIYVVLRVLPLRALDEALMRLTHSQRALRVQVRATDEALKVSERASRAKSEFLANLSHEFRTPLNAILGYSEMIRLGMVRAGDDPVGRHREYAADIHESGALLLRLIGDLLDLSKAEAGRIELDRQPLDAGAAIRRCCAVVRGRADEAGVALTDLTPNGETFVMRADELRVKQVLLNILSNAVKFTPRGGSISVRAERTADGGIAIVVSDTGPGMAAELIPPLALEPYRQLEQSAAIKAQGTGLGLPLSKRLMELHGGSLIIESALGRGTTVRMIFPPQPSPV